MKREVLRNLRQMVTITCCSKTRKAIGSLFMRRVASKWLFGWAGIERYMGKVRQSAVSFAYAFYGS